MKGHKLNKSNFRIYKIKEIYSDKLSQIYTYNINYYAFLNYFLFFLFNMH